MPLSRPLPDQLIELMAEFLGVLGQPVRIRILETLVLEGEMTVQVLAEAVGVSQQNVSKHLQLLHARDLVARRREGRLVWYGLADDWVLGLLDDLGVRILERVRDPVLPDSGGSQGNHT